MKAIILGDIHLGAGLSLGRTGVGSTLNSRIADQSRLLEWTLDQAIAEGADCIISTGDVFEDPRPSPTLVSLFVSWLKRCTDNEIKVHIVKGNHDIIRSGQHNTSAFDIISAADLDDVFIYNDIQTLDFQGISFTFLPFRDRRSFNTDVNSEALTMLEDKLKYERCGIDNRNIKIAIGHFALAGSLPVGDEIDDMNNEIFIPIKTMDCYDFSFFGHIHKPQVMQKSSLVSHIGSMDLSNFSESSHSKIIAVINSDNPNIYDFRELPSRPMKQISVSVPANITNTTEYIVAAIKKENKDLSRALVKMSITYESPDLTSVERPVIEKLLSELGAFYVPRIDQDRKIVQVKKSSNIEIDSKINELTAIKMYAEDNVDSEIRNNFISLANSIVKEIKEPNVAN